MPENAAPIDQDPVYVALLAAADTDEPMTTSARGSAEIAEALGFEPDNHHNALACPYCGDLRSKVVQEERERLAAEVRSLRDKGDWGFWTAAYQDGIDRAARLVEGAEK